jgi:hypothetical protein
MCLRPCQTLPFVTHQLVTIINRHNGNGSDLHWH